MQTAALGGEEYARSLTESECDSMLVEYNLGTRQDRFLATAGVSDTARDAGVVLRYTVSVDDREVLQRDARIGAPIVVDLDVGGALRLKLSVVRLSGESRWCAMEAATWGDPRIVGPPGTLAPADG